MTRGPTLVQRRGIDIAHIVNIIGKDGIADDIFGVEPFAQVNQLTATTAKRSARCIFALDNFMRFVTGWARVANHAIGVLAIEFWLTSADTRVILRDLCRRHSRESGNPSPARCSSPVLDSRMRGSDEPL